MTILILTKDQYNVKRCKNQLKFIFKMKDLDWFKSILDIYVYEPLKKTYVGQVKINIFNMCLTSLTYKYEHFAAQCTIEVIDNKRSLNIM